MVFVIPEDGSASERNGATQRYKMQVAATDPEAGQANDKKAFNPFLERKVDNPTTDCETLTHVLKSSMGTGILAMPAAFRSAGLAVGVFATIFVSLICTHCSYILVKCAHTLYHRTRKTQMSYAEVAEGSFATGPKWARSLAKPSR